MKNVRNENGYALLVVLLTIVLIGILVPPIVNSVLNSAKQNNKTEEVNQLTNIAEMGIVYFRNFKDDVEDAMKQTMEDELKKLRDQLESEYQNADPSAEAPDVEKAKNDLKKDYINQFTNELKAFFQNGQNHSPIYFEPVTLNVELTQDPKEQFTYKDIDVQANEDEYYIEIAYTSVAEKKLESNIIKELREDPPLRIEFDKVDVDIVIDTGPDEGTGGELEFYKYCPTSGTHIVNKNCLYRDNVDIKQGTDITINGEVIFKKKFDVKKNSTFKINGNVSIAEEVKINGGSFIVNGNVSIADRVKVNDGSFIVKGDVSIADEVQVNGGSFKVNGDVEIEVLKITNSGKLIIDGDLYISGKLTINPGGTLEIIGKNRIVCIVGGGDIKGSFTIDGRNINNVPKNFGCK